MSSQSRQGQPTVPGPQPSVDSAASARTSGMRSMTGADPQVVADNPATQPSEKRRRVDTVSTATAAFTEVKSTESSNTTTGTIKERSSRACLNCRKHKMKCENADDPPCKRCRASGRTCVFQQRANAAWGADNAIWAEIVEVRLRELETEMRTIKAMSMRGRPPSAAAWPTHHLTSNGDLSQKSHRRLSNTKRYERSPSTGSIFPDVEWPRETSADVAIQWSTAGESSTTGEMKSRRQHMQKLYQAVTSVKGLAPSSFGSDMWGDDVVEELWIFFDRQLYTIYPRVPRPLSLDTLSPLLLLSLLYAASYHHPEDHMAALAPAYASHLSQLVAGRNDPTTLYQDAALDSQVEISNTFESVVGLLVVCQTLLGSARCVPQWISVAHRWLLDAYGKDHSVLETDWSNLWEWMHELDVYSSGLLLQPTIISPQPPSPPFAHQSPTSFPSPGKVLLHINNDGCKHFAGRGLTSVLDVVWGDSTSLLVHSSPLDKRDEQLKQDWLAELDRWRVRYSEEAYDIAYHLHRVFNLAIGFKTLDYHGQENLVSEAKTALHVFTNSSASHSMWDMVMITFSARMILDVISTSSSADEDLALVERTARHLLKPAPGLGTSSHRSALATRIQELVTIVRQSSTKRGESFTIEPSEMQARSASIEISIPSMPTTAPGIPFEHSQSSQSMNNTTAGNRFGLPSPILHATYPLPNQTLAGMTPGARFDDSTFWQGSGNSGSLSTIDVMPHLGTRDTAQWQNAMLTTPRTSLLDVSVSNPLHSSPYIPPQSTAGHRDDTMRPVSQSNVFDAPPTLLQGQESWPPAFLSWLANNTSQ